MAKKNVAAAPAPPPKEYASGMDKLRDEMAADQSCYVRVVGEYLTNYLLDHPEAEAAIMTEGKTIKGSLDAMKKEAMKHKNGSVAVLDDVTGFRIVREYFGIEDAPTTAGKAVASVEATHAPVDPFDLDALMGGV